VVAGQQAAGACAGVGAKRAGWAADGPQSESAVKPVWAQRRAGLGQHPTRLARGVSVKHIQLTVRKGAAPEADADAAPQRYSEEAAAAVRCREAASQGRAHEVGRRAEHQKPTIRRIDDVERRATASASAQATSDSGRVEWVATGHGHVGEDANVATPANDTATGVSGIVAYLAAVAAAQGQQREWQVPATSG